MAALNETTVPQLLYLIGLPDTPLFVDISIGPDFADDPILIARALRPRHTDLAGSKEQLGSRPCSVGLSHQSRDDQVQLEAAVALDDAAYLRVPDGTGKGHNWPAQRWS